MKLNERKSVVDEEHRRDVKRGKKMRVWVFKKEEEEEDESEERKRAG